MKDIEWCDHTLGGLLLGKQKRHDPALQGGVENTLITTPHMRPG